MTFVKTVISSTCIQFCLPRVSSLFHFLISSGGGYSPPHRNEVGPDPRRFYARVKRVGGLDETGSARSTSRPTVETGAGTGGVRGRQNDDSGDQDRDRRSQRQTEWRQWRPGQGPEESEADRMATVETRTGTGGVRGRQNGDSERRGAAVSARLFYLFSLAFRYMHGQLPKVAYF